MNFLAQKRKKILLQETLPNSSKENLFDDFYYQEIALLTGAGGYCINFVDKTTFIDPQGRKILQLPKDFKPSLTRNLVHLYADSEKFRVMNTFAECSEGVPFKTTVKMVKHTGEEFWAKAIGKPMYDKEGDVIGIQGVFQDISAEKKREIELENSIKTIASQNTRLLNYAHLVSHNLRSHANNLKLALELLGDLDNPKDEVELIDGLSTISEELCSTIKHLSQIVTIQDKSKDKKQPISFAEGLHEAKKGLQTLISDNRVEIFTDFSEAPHIEYIPAYLISIFRNLVSNAIQFRHPDRNPVIDIYTLEKEGVISLTIKDNGLGFDVKQHQDQLFNIYQTFHNGPKTRGTGLFMVKNQIEALNGNIRVESEPGQGTTFRISF
ncbi:PAS domain S-box protein [Rasiella rasia]|uniref:histidine kinase n=1 Tax=Rasiella rasia TaxID=2744027 RepID=A0A6G6GNS9_9FLAO|nr:PAS domain-containing sensor histidine kinase [Rasiella rasia]QIE60073.1 PAS domain S-box protein [Rasiella rasia]